MQLKEFEVNVTVHERYVAYVQATDYEEAEALAREKYDSGELDIVSYSESFEAEEVNA